MIKKSLMAIFVSALFINICAAQLSNAQSIANWGKSTNGVQLSISLTNNILAAGSSSSVQYEVENLSTNTIGWGIVDATQGFDVFLTNNSGKIYFLTPQPDTNSEYESYTYVLYYKMKPGEKYKNSVPISISNKIKPGNYQLEAKLHFSIAEKRPIHKYELVSNSLEVEIK
jgi:hypothetical protein